LPDIRKITSGSTPDTADAVDMLYSSILNVSTHKAPSIKTAEAAKVIENTQRDLNIAFVNELAKICRLLGIDTNDVLDAAGTKWNFLPFRPGLVGGHCIGVDPYYLTHKAQSMGYIPEVILAGRRINDGMGRFVAGEVLKIMISKDVKIKNSKVLQLGITFKEDCRDIRNSRSADVAHTLEEYGCNVTVFDPHADPDEVRGEYGLDCVSGTEKLLDKYDAVIMAVAHKEFADLDIRKYLHSSSTVFDIKGKLPREITDSRL
jgi:UDP-N-acetyl-D-galactosamine dehydrogenase